MDLDLNTHLFACNTVANSRWNHDDTLFFPFKISFRFRLISETYGSMQLVKSARPFVQGKDGWHYVQTVQLISFIPAILTGTDDFYPLIQLISFIPAILTGTDDFYPLILLISFIPAILAGADDFYPSIQLISFIPAILTGTDDFYPSILLSVNLTLAGDHRVSRKQNLSAPFFWHTF